MQNLRPDTFQSRIAAAGGLLLDVRTPAEVAIAALPGARCIPLDELARRLTELDRDAPISIYCHHGVRSAFAGDLLERNGFTDVAHLIGGIDAWSRSIDPTVPRY